MRRSPGHHPSPFATRTAFTAGERLGLEPPPNTKIRFLHTLETGNDSAADFSFHLGARVSFGVAYAITCIVIQLAASAGFSAPSISTLTS